MSSIASSETKSMSASDVLNEARIEGDETQSMLLLSTQSKSRRSAKYLPTQTDIFDYRESFSQLIKSIDAQQILATPDTKKQNRKVVDLTKTMTIKGKKGRLYEQICPVCLAEYESPFGVLQCKHKFCFQCIKAWSDTSTGCPCCRKSFSDIIKMEGENKQVVKVQQKKMVYREEDYFICYVCGSGDNQNVLLICDMCDFNCCHIYCDQSLGNTIPEGDWYCRNCQQATNRSQVTISMISQIPQSHPNNSQEQQQKPIAQRTRSRNEQHLLNTQVNILRRLRRRR